ncbi:MAG: universal stress protein [Desulfobacteraceae bacterium]|nr:universal stress protein [Desulfobacteraceae bacterium]
MRVLIATDGSVHSMKALERGLELAEKEGAQITLMTVALFPSDFDELLPNIQDKLEASAKEVLRQARAKFEEKGIPVESIFEVGTVPADNIIEQAEQGKYDRIIMGSKGASGIMRFLIGSTAARVVAHAPCSVTVVR